MRKTVWEKRADVSEIQQDQNPFENTGSMLLDALNRFDREREGLYDWLSSIAVEAPEAAEYHQATSELIDNTADAFTELALAVRISSSDIDDEKKQIEKLILQDDNERVELFSQLVECECFDALNEERAQEIVNDIYSESEDEKGLSEVIHTIYRANLAGDIQSFAGHVQEKHDQVEAITQSEIVNETSIDMIISVPQLKKNALDIAKIALGASIALMASRKFMKK
jgi:hypothetical protein